MLLWAEESTSWTLDRTQQKHTQKKNERGNSLLPSFTSSGFLKGFPKLPVLHGILQRTAPGDVLNGSHTYPGDPS